MHAGSFSRKKSTLVYLKKILLISIYLNFKFSAIGHLSRATQMDENSGGSWYFLGRCYSAVRDVNHVR